MAEPLQFNFRVVREDKQPIKGREVMAVLRYFLDHQSAPNGYRIEATSWKRNNRAPRYPQSEQAAADAMQQFWYMLKETGLQGIRMGAVKRDRL